MRTRAPPPPRSPLGGLVQHCLVAQEVCVQQAPEAVLEALGRALGVQDARGHVAVDRRARHRAILRPPHVGRVGPEHLHAAGPRARPSACSNPSNRGGNPTPPHSPALPRAGAGGRGPGTGARGSRSPAAAPCAPRPRARTPAPGTGSATTCARARRRARTLPPYFIPYFIP